MNVEFRKGVRIALVLRLYFQNHLVFVGRRVDGGYLPGAVSGEKSVLDLIRRNAQGLRPVAIDIQRHLRTGDLQIAGHVDEAAQGANSVQQDRHPMVDLMLIGTLQRQLIGALRIVAADADGRGILQKRLNAGNGEKSWAAIPAAPDRPRARADRGA